MASTRTDCEWIQFKDPYQGWYGIRIFEIQTIQVADEMMELFMPKIQKSRMDLSGEPETYCAAYWQEIKRREEAGEPHEEFQLALRSLCFSNYVISQRPTTLRRNHGSLGSRDGNNGDHV